MYKNVGATVVKMLCTIRFGTDVSGQTALRRVILCPHAPSGQGTKTQYKAGILSVT